jgi:transposase
VEYWDQAKGPRERVALRASAVQAVVKGEKKRHVARRFGVTRQTLHNWVAKHQRGGAEALVAKPRGRARRMVLEPSQEAQVADAIVLLSPATVNRRYTSWTKKAIADFIEQRFGVRLSAWLVDSHLRRWGFKSHKQARQAFANNHARDDASSWLPEAPAAVSTRL